MDYYVRISRWFVGLKKLGYWSLFSARPWELSGRFLQIAMGNMALRRLS